MALPQFEPEIRLFSKLSIIFITLGIFGFLIILLPYFFPEVNFKTLGELGSFSNGILSPIVGIAATLLTFLAFYVQYLANLEIQKQFQIQQLESQFYEMLRLHKENINEMKITGYDSLETTISSTQGEDNTIERSEIIRFTEGRKVFVTMNTELLASITLVKKFNEEWGKPLAKKQVLKLAYQFFFFGSKSGSVKVKKVKKKLIRNFAIELEAIRAKHKRSFGQDNRFGLGNDETTEIYIKYKPFSGHESRLGHYYRHLFNTVEYIVDQKIISTKEKRKYLKLLRSQMSNDEHLLLYYNYIIGFGKEWGNKEYLTTYRMAKNLPIERVKYVQKPRKHFKKFIESLGDSKDRMFERGDFDSKK